MVVFDGFSKAYGMTGWRLGFAHGPQRLIEEMIKLQQFTFVCAPSIVQHAGVAAWDADVSGFVADYRRKRDRLVAGLKDRFELAQPGGALLPLSQGTLGHRQRIRGGGDPQQPADHPRQGVQPPRHPFPPQLCRRRSDHRARHRNPQSHCVALNSLAVSRGTGMDGGFVRHAKPQARFLPPEAKNYPSLARVWRRGTCGEFFESRDRRHNP